ncbi:MAG: threonine--tRNA ligase [Opitutaceae bacterium]|nr:threonine--tRNA ligase [Opitutaceae bacterium]
MSHVMSPLEELRHSGSHILATAILRLFPDAKLDIGPPTDTGFYYDIDLEHKLTADDLIKLEAEMKKVADENQPFLRKEVSREEAAAIIQERGQERYKLGRLADIPEGEKISFYQNGEFMDLCAGTHVRYSSKLKAFKLLSIAGAYHRGDEKNKQLQRIYGTAFPTKEELAQYLENLELAKARDHRKLGKELQLFTFDTEDVGPGLPLWLPKGTVLIEELEKLAKETEFAAGYERVRTPHIARESMYKKSGHLPYYADSMFPPMTLADKEGEASSTSDGDRYYLKAMNCPHHHKIFDALPRSYRDLPLRLAEYGTCYRYEQSGELLGLMRVRSMQMNDAHIYCTEEQFSDEFRAVNEMYLKYFKLFGLGKNQMRFSTHDPAKLGQKFVNEPELWKKTEDMVRQVLVESGINFVEVPNEAAFYGPKIDVQVWSIVGREFTIATNQVDFAVPARFGLEYVTSENTKATPLCIHRAPLGTHERFIAFLIEHFGGDFPVWLAPEQVRLLPISDKVEEYSRALHAKLKAAGCRATLDEHNEKLGAKIRRAELDKVPYTIVIGQKEAENNSVSVRSRARGDEGVMTADAYLEKLRTEIATRALPEKKVGAVVPSRPPQGA